MSMYAQFYAHMPWRELPIFALLLFVTVFAAVVLKFVVFTSRAELEPLARLPLEPDLPVLSETEPARERISSP
jgi:hypothetical protein